MCEYAPEERLEFAIAAPSSPSRAASPELPQLPHNEALMDALVELPKPGVDAEGPQPPPPPTRRSTPTRASKGCKVQELGPWYL